MLCRLLTVILIFISTRQQFEGIVSTNNYINQNANYTITIPITASDITAGNYLLFEFDIDYYSTSSLLSTTCDPTCTKQGTTILRFNSLTNNNNVLTLVANNIINPPVSGYPSYRYTIITSGGTVIKNITFNSIQFQNGQLTSCNVVFSPNIVNNNGSMRINVSPSNNVLQGGKIVIRLPTSWTYSVGTQSILSSNLICTPVTNLNTELNCSFIQSGNIQITIINAFSSNNSSPFSLNISYVKSIPVSYQSTQINLMTRSSTDKTIDSGSCTISTPTPLNTIFSSTNTMNVGSQFSLATTSNLKTKITQYDTITIVIPINIVSNSNPSFSFQSNLGCSFSNLLLASTLLSNISNSTSKILIYNLTGNGASSASACTEINITISSFPLVLPSSFSKTINFYFKRQGYSYSEGYIDLVATPNLLNVNTITFISNTTIINKPTMFNISFITLTDLIQGSSIIIIIPPSMVVSTATCQNALLNSTSFYPNCNIASHNLTISNFGRDIPAGSTVRFSFSGISNPASTQTVSFSIATIYTDGGTVDYFSNINYTATPDSIISANVTSTSYTNGDQANYTLNVNIRNEMPINSLALIRLPIGLTFNSSAATCSFLLNGNFLYIINFSKITSAGPQYNDAINVSLNNVAIIAPNSNLSFTFGLLNNPITTQPSKSFSIYFSSSGNYLIQTGLSGIEMTMLNPSNFIDSSISSGSPINGQTTTYTLKIRPSTKQPANSILSVTLPTQIKILTGNQCYNNGILISCVYSSSVLQITLGTQLTAGLSYIYTFTNVMNPRTQSPTASFTISTKSSGFDVSSSSTAGITNSQPNNINVFYMNVINPLQSYMKSNQTLRFVLTTKNYLTSNDYIRLTFPNQYIYLGTPGTTFSCQPYSCISDSLNPLIVKVTAFPQNITNFTFAINNYLSPISSTSDNFIVSTHQAIDNSLIDQINMASSSAQVLFTLSCIPPCQTCLITNSSSCLTCYASDVNTNTFYYNGSCYITCPNITYTSGSNCLPCQSPCKTCSSTATICTSCVSSYYLFSSNSQCVTECPATFYGNLSNGQCRECQSPCVNCSFSSNNCTSCISPYMIQGNQCVSSCSDGYYNNSNHCYQCDISCNRCVSISTNCTTCASNYIRSGNQCALTCEPSKVNISNNCVSCHATCYQCSVSTTNCVSCQSGRYLYNGGCLVNCPSSTILLNGICEDAATASSLSNSKLIPFPYVISCTIICIICFLSKFSSPLTSIPAMGLSLNSVFQFLAMITILVLTSISFQGLQMFEKSELKSIGLTFLIIALILDLIINTMTVIYFCKKIQSDSSYIRWKKKPENKLVRRLSIGISSLTYKFIYFQFCKAFGSSHLHATLSNPTKFYPITIMTLVGVFDSILVVTGCSLIALDKQTILLSPMYIQAIDCLLIKIVGAIFALASLKKSQDFFEDLTKRNTDEQNLNQYTIQGFNDQNNYEQHSKSYVAVGTSPQKSYPNLDLADQSLMKKDTGKIDDKDYYKTNKQTQILNQLIYQEQQQSLVQEKKQSKEDEQILDKLQNSAGPIQKIENNSSAPQQNKFKTLGQSINISLIRKKRHIRKMPDDNNQPVGMDNFEQTVSKQLPQSHDSQIEFVKTSNLQNDQENNIPLKTRTKRQINELDQQLADNSGLIDSSAHATEMIEGLVKGMSYPNKTFERKIYHDSEEIQSANEGNIQFNEISPSQFNIQNQRYETCAELQKDEIYSRQLPFQNLRRVDFTQDLSKDSQTQIGIQLNPLQISSGLPRLDSKFNLPLGVQKNYGSFDLVPIYEGRGKSSARDLNVNVNKSLPRHRQYETITNQDLSKRHRLKSLQKIYLQRLDIKKTSKKRL